MPTREELHSLAQDIIGAYDSRATAHTARHREVSAQRQAAQSQLQEMERGRRQAAGQQREGLAEGRAHLAPTEASRKAQVGTWLHEVATERAGAQEEWRNMGATMHAKRAGAPGAAEAAPKTGPTPPGPSEPGGPGQRSGQTKAHRARR